MNSNCFVSSSKQTNTLHLTKENVAFVGSLLSTYTVVQRQKSMIGHGLQLFIRGTNLSV